MGHGRVRRGFLRVGLLVGLPFGAVGAWAVGTAFSAHAAVTCTTSWSSAVSGNFSDGTNWSNGAPTSTSDACITVAGNYVVTVNGNTSVHSLHLGSGTAAKLEELDVQGVACGLNRDAAFTVTTAVTVKSTGKIDLTSTGCGNANASLTAGSMSSAGILQSDVGSGGARALAGSLTNQGGQVNINAATTWSGPGTFDNNGTTTIADGVEFLTVASTSAAFTNDTSGSVVTSGDSTTGDLRVDSSNTFNEAGTTSGGPVYVDNSTLNYTGTGASSIDARGSVSSSLTGNIAHGQSLTLLGTACGLNQDAVETLSTNMANAGVIDLNSTGCGNAAAALKIAGGVALTNAANGVIQTDVGSNGARTLVGTLSNDGTVNIDAPTAYAPVGATWTNAGPLNLADGATLELQSPPTGQGPSTFTNAAGGAIAAPGAVGSGVLQEDAGNVYNEGGGTSTAAVVVQNSALNYTGGGASTITVQGSTGSTLTGNMVSGQTLDIEGVGCGINQNSDESLTTSMTSAGAINLLAAGCAPVEASLTVAPTNTLTLTGSGVLTASATGGGPRNLHGNITSDGHVNINVNANWTGGGTFDNNGVVTVADSTEFLTTAASGATFTNDTSGSVVTTGDVTTGDLRVADGNVFNEAGASSGGPIIVDNSTLHYTGSGASSISVRGSSPGTTLTGNIASGQTLTVLGTACGINQSASVSLTTNMTNAGTIDMTSAGCGVSNDTFTVGTGLTLTNAASGIIQTDRGAAGKRAFSHNITNNGHFNIKAPTAWNGKGTFDNSGTVTINSSLSVGGKGVFTNEAAGTVTNAGTFSLGTATTFNEAGTVTHHPVVITNGNLHYFGAGASTFNLRGSVPGVTLTGNISAGQKIVALGTACSINQDAVVTLGASLTNAGTIDLSSAGCGPVGVTLTIPAGDVLTNTGTLQTDVGTGGGRAVAGNVTNQGGHVTVNAGTTWAGPGTFDNNGTVTVADSVELLASASSSATFTNDVSGTVASTGSATTGDLRIDAGNVLNEAGTTSGGPVYVDNSTLNYTGTGASSIDQRGSTSSTLSGNIAAGQTLTVLGVACGLNQNAVVSDAASLTDAGSIVLTSSGCGAVSATLNLAAGKVLTVSAGGLLSSASGVGGARTVTGDVVNNGQMFPGGLSTLNVTGNYTQGSGGSININVQTGGASDHLVVAGTATLAGDAVAVPVAGYTPAHGDSFPSVVQAASVAGTWAVVSGPGGTWAGNYTATTAGITFS